MSLWYPCVYCTEDLKCTKFSDNKFTSYCLLGPCHDETKSNADRIRQMSDEELADLLTAVAKKSAEMLCKSLETVEVDLSKCDFEILTKSLLPWLKSPVEVDK